MFSEIQYMKKAELYCIRNRKTGLYLTSGKQITCTPRVLGKITQYWLCDQVKPTMYQIVSLQTGEVLTRTQPLTIQKGKWNSNQFWLLQRAQIAKEGNYFWMVAHDNQQKYLFGSSVSEKVSMSSFDKTLYVSNWKFERIDDTEQLSGCCVFRSKFSDLVIDVPEGSNKQGIMIIQYSYNGRGNQRWVLETLKKQFIIRNICSNLVLCPHNKTLKNGNKIMQTQFTNHQSQKWLISSGQERPDDENHYTIRNSENPELMLSVSSNKQCANLILSTEKQKSIWKLQGNVPQVLEAKELI